MTEIQKGRLIAVSKRAAKAVEIESSNSAKLERVTKALLNLATLVESRSSNPVVTAAKSILSKPHLAVHYL